MVAFQQDKRLLAINTPLGTNAVLLVHFAGTETMSRLFSYQLDVISPKGDLAPNAIVGKNVTWVVQHQHSQPRYFNGFVSRFSSGGKALHDLYAYRLEVVPWLWFLTRTTNCRIYPPNKTGDEVVEKVFTDAGFKDFKFDLVKSPPFRKREYCVQYRETAFNFVSRILEEEGIFYYFKHENGKHTLVLSNKTGGYHDVPENKVRYSLGAVQANYVNQWSHQYEFRPGRWAHTDYNFEDPLTPLNTKTETTIDVPNVKAFELFDYPGDYFLKPDGEAETKVRMEEEEAAYNVVSGAGFCCTFTPGGKFTVAEHDVAAEANKGYVITSVQHSATDNSYGNAAAKSNYRNAFTAIPDKVLFRPTSSTPRPVVNGPQPAVVVGPKDKEIHTDKYGRVRVQFFWDREGKKDENSTTWVRVAQIWAGKRWGASFWPRIGQEVVVAFHEGDPDRPIIIGSVYNADQMPPYQGDGPDSKHKNDNQVSGIKTNTTPGGKGYNEIRFDDTKDKEQVFIHGERNMDVRVKGSSMETVGGSAHLTVGGEKDGNKTGEIRMKVFKNLHEHVMNDEVRFVEHDQHETVKNNRVTEVLDGGHFAAAPKGDTVFQGKTIYLDATTEIQLTCGGNFIKISPAGVSIVGKLVKINCPGDMAGPVPPAPAGSGGSGKKAGATTMMPEDPVAADNSVTGQKSAPG